VTRINHIILHPGPYLRLYQDKIYEQNHEIMLDILVGEPFAARTLRQTNAFPESPVVCFAMRRIQGLHGVATFDANHHRQEAKRERLQHALGYARSAVVFQGTTKWSKLPRRRIQTSHGASRNGSCSHRSKKNHRLKKGLKSEIPA
jgi:hypothetical protein